MGATTSFVDQSFSRRSFVIGSAAIASAFAFNPTAMRLASAQADVTNASNRVQTIVDAAEAFLATLSADEQSAVLFDWSDTAQKQNWSNLPEALFPRAGIMWGNMTEETQQAWLGVMQATLSDSGYQRIIIEWNADDIIAAGGGDLATGGGPSGGNGGPGGTSDYGTQYFFAALIGSPSTTDPWQWQFTGHHVTVNATIANGMVALTPSFIGNQPSTYTDADGNEVRPLGDIHDDALALVQSLDTTQQSASVLGTEFIDLVVGPGQDGVMIEPEGIVATDLNADQQATLLSLIGRYTGLLNDDHAAARLEEVSSTLDSTYFIWYGPTDGGPAYFRVAGPRVVIEYSPQNQLTTDPAEHIHGIYRDPANDYGVAYVDAATA